MKTLTMECLPAGLIRAWSLLSPRRKEPLAAELVKTGAKGDVYRLYCGGWTSNVIAKRTSTARARTEELIYERILPHLPIEGCAFHGCVHGADPLESWLFIGEAEGIPFDGTSPIHRRAVAEWLAALHTGLPEPLSGMLPVRGSPFYLERLALAESSLRERLSMIVTTAEGRLLEAILLGCSVIRERWGELTETLNALPGAFIHGDFFEWNFLLRPSSASPVLLAFDWEAAGWGWPAVDLYGLYEAEAPVYRAHVSHCWTISQSDLEAMVSYGGILRLLSHHGLVVRSPSTPWGMKASAMWRRRRHKLEEIFRRLAWS